MCPSGSTDIYAHYRMIATAVHKRSNGVSDDSLPVASPWGLSQDVDGSRTLMARAVNVDTERGDKQTNE